MSQRANDEGSQMEENLMSISKEAMNDAENSRTLRLHGTVQEQEVIMLVDSGSSHYFISKEFAQRLNGAQRPIKLVQVRVANGGLLDRVKEFPRCLWDVQGNTFFTTFRILPLRCYPWY